MLVADTHIQYCKHIPLQKDFIIYIYIYFLQFIKTNTVYTNTLPFRSLGSVRFFERNKYFYSERIKNNYKRFVKSMIN